MRLAALPIARDGPNGRWLVTTSLARRRYAGDGDASRRATVGAAAAHARSGRSPELAAAFMYDVRADFTQRSLTTATAGRKSVRQRAAVLLNATRACEPRSITDIITVISDSAAMLPPRPNAPCRAGIVRRLLLAVVT